MKDFRNVKAGDKVIIDKYRRKEAKIIEYVSNDYIIVEGMEFNRSDGVQNIPKGYVHYHLIVASDEEWREVKDNNLKELVISAIRKERLEDYNLKELNAICAIINFLRK